MRNPRAFIIGTLAALILATGSVASAQNGATVILENAIWANGELYGTVATPTSFRNAPRHSTDVIYSFMMNELQGQRSVSEAAPGDSDYNGGRWSVHFAFYTAQGETYFDGNGDGIVDYELTSEEEVHEQEALGNLEIVDANFYFVCPLLP
jgi:ABC-type glycerol-3-phosphate transport system substrate-binding protein